VWLPLSNSLALSDWFEAPVIHGVRRQDGCICVDVPDHVQVASVRITILGEPGGAQGQAVWIQDARWKYTASIQGKLLLEAFDLAGNVTCKEL
jgi:hypothetical protein